MEIQGIVKVITANPEGIPYVWARFYDIPSWSCEKKKKTEREREREIPTGTKWCRRFSRQSESDLLCFLSARVETSAEEHRSDWQFNVHARG